MTAGRNLTMLLAFALGGAAPLAPLAPPFRLALFGGGTISDRDLSGKLVILNFWAPWCAPCKRELADLDAFAARYGTKRVTVVAIDAEAKPDLRLIARQAAAMHIPVALDVEQGGDTYHPIRSAVPTTFVIDPAGRLILTHAGVLSPDDLDRITAALGPVVTATRTER